MASRLEANIVRDFEPDLRSFCLRTFDDGRFIVRANGKVIFNEENAGRFPKYEDDIKPRLSSML